MSFTTSPPVDGRRGRLDGRGERVVTAYQESGDILDEARGQAAFDAPDTLDHLIEIGDMVTMQAAQRLIGVNVLRCEALADAARRGPVLTDMVERSVRLEVAAALRITEGEAGSMMALGEALVERYPGVLDSFAGARMTERHARILVEAVDTVEPSSVTGCSRRRSSSRKRSRSVRSGANCAR